MDVSNLTIVEAWNELNKINNKINLLETLIETQYSIGSSKLKEILFHLVYNFHMHFLINIVFLIQLHLHLLM